MSDNAVLNVDFDNPDLCTKSSPVRGCITVNKKMDWSTLLVNIIVILERLYPDRYKYIARKLLNGGFNGSFAPVLYRSSDSISRRAKELPHNYFIGVNRNVDKIAVLLNNFVDYIGEGSVRVKIAVRYGDNNSLHKVNFNTPEDCQGSTPVRCTIDFDFSGRWTQLFLLILEILKTFFPEQYNLLKDEGFTEDSRPLLYKRKPSWMLSPKQLSDGYWVESHGAASALVTRIKRFSDFISNGAARVKIQYLPRNPGASAVKPTPRPTVQPKQTQPKVEPQPEVVKPVQSGNGPQKVDFHHPDLCKGTRPVLCMLNGEEVPVGETWRDLLVNILDYLRLYNHDKYDELKEHGFQQGTKSRLSHQPSLMKNPKQLNDGYFVEAKEISIIVYMIKRFTEYIGEGKLPIEILYVPKEDSSEQAPVSNSNDTPEEDGSIISCSYNELKNSLGVIDEDKWIPESNPYEDNDPDDFDDDNSDNDDSDNDDSDDDDSDGDYEDVSDEDDSDDEDSDGDYEDDSDEDDSDDEDSDGDYEDDSDEDDSDDEEFDEDDSEGDDYENDLIEDYSKAKKALFGKLLEIIKNESCWKSGIDFSSNVKQILSDRCNEQLDDGLLTEFRNEYAFKLGGRDSKTYQLFDSVAPLAIQREILCAAYAWLEDYRVFQLECLYNLYKDQLDQVGVIQTSEDFENYLVAAWKWCPFKNVPSIKFFGWPYNSTRFVRDSAYNWNDSFEKLGERLVEVVQNHDDVMISQEDLCKAIPCISLSLLDRFIKSYASKLRTCDLSIGTYYQTEEAYFSSLSLPNDFPDTLSKVLEQIYAIGLPPTEQTLLTMLSTQIGGNFLKRYGIAEDDNYEAFCDVIAYFYKGTPKREWGENENGEWAFDVVAPENEEQNSEDGKDESLDESSNLLINNNDYDKGDFE